MEAGEGPPGLEPTGLEPTVPSPVSHEPAADQALSPGARVRAHGLKAPELRKQGHRTTGHRLFCKDFLGFNTAPCHHMPLTCALLKAQPQLNGQLGTAVEWDEGEGRWKVMMDDGAGKMLRAANLELMEAGEGPPSPNVAVPSSISRDPGAEPGLCTAAISPGARVRAHSLKLSGR